MFCLLLPSSSLSLSLSFPRGFFESAHDGLGLTKKKEEGEREKDKFLSPKKHGKARKKKTRISRLWKIALGLQSNILQKSERERRKGKLEEIKNTQKQRVVPHSPFAFALRIIGFASWEGERERNVFPFPPPPSLIIYWLVRVRVLLFFPLFLSLLSCLLPIAWKTKEKEKRRK